MSAIPELARRPITVDEFFVMAQAGVFDDDERVELIEGALVKMAPVGPPHSMAVNILNRRLVMAFGEGAVVGVQNSIALRPLSAPQPDFAILRADMWKRPKTPEPTDLVLVIEVADSSLATDRRIKVPLYARHAVPEVWLVDIPGRVVHVYSDCRNGRYLQQVDRHPGEYLTLDAFPDVRIAVDELFVDESFSSDSSANDSEPRP
jgi:Uma2 family endonuclease